MEILLSGDCLVAGIPARWRQTPRAAIVPVMAKDQMKMMAKS